MNSPRNGISPASAPFFPQGAAIRVVHREGVVLLGGGRALLMQVAHPKIAAAVAQHSRFREGKRQRLLRTLRPTLAIVFGSEAQACAAAASVNRVHVSVNGEGYRAGDPELLFWVLATLIDTALVVHERLLRPVAPDIAESYYRDMLRAGSLLGVRRGMAPPDLAAFRRYMAAQERDLEVTDDARAIAADLFGGPGLTGRVAGWGIRSVTAGLLPEGLRSAFGLDQGSVGRPAWGVSEAALRALLPRLPQAIRGMPRMLLPDGAELWTRSPASS